MSSWFFSPKYMANPSILLSSRHHLVSMCYHHLSSALLQVSPYPFLLLTSILYTAARVISLVHTSDCHLLFSLKHVPIASKIKSKSFSIVKRDCKTWLLPTSTAASPPAALCYLPNSLWEWSFLCQVLSSFYFTLTPNFSRISLK